MSIKEEHPFALKNLMFQLNMLNRCDFLLRTAVYDEKNTQVHRQQTRGLLSDIDTFMSGLQQRRIMETKELPYETKKRLGHGKGGKPKYPGKGRAGTGKRLLSDE